MLYSYLLSLILTKFDNSVIHFNVSITSELDSGEITKETDRIIQVLSSIYGQVNGVLRHGYEIIKEYLVEHDGLVLPPKYFDLIDEEGGDL